MDALYLEMDSEVSINNTPLARTSSRMIKRTFDILVASMVLVFIYPWIYILVASCIKIFMPGPIMFKQRRTGKDEIGRAHV